jgi:hypothetical protein
MTPDESASTPRYGNAAYYDWLEAVIKAATRRNVPWTAVELGILLDRTIRAHEAEATGGPKCAECIAMEADQ